MTFLLPEVQGLRLVDVYDRGVANKECLGFLVDEMVDMGQFGVMLGWQHAPGVAVPFTDFLFYFGAGKVQKGDWIFLYTGHGEPRKIPTTDRKATIYSLYWGRPTTLFASSNVVPMLFQIGGVTVGKSPENQPQLSNLEDALRKQLG